MKKAKNRKQTPKEKKKSARRKSTPSKHPVHGFVDELREIIHSRLASKGITGLSLRSMQFATNDQCPDGQHWGKVCESQAGGKEVCTWQCVPN
ncbi:MAG TPA: hypothetical protein VMU26_23075 [Candidatus Polarisedimenticolia bacterium]|nr:hypothetical protein [Candidatus Polarisedimenticolia bacterium]